MINAKIKIFSSEYAVYLESDLNKFLETIDIRQVIKTEHSASAGTLGYRYTAIIYYVEKEDIRDMKIDKIIEI